MAQGQLSTLVKARDHIVEQRRLCIEELAKAYERGKTEQMMDLLLKLQSVIDVLDKVRLLASDDAVEQVRNVRDKLAKEYGRHPDDTSDD